MRRSPRLEEALPVLYLRGLSTGDFSEALEALLGPEAAGFSATTITRLLKVWQEEYEVWRKRLFKGKDYVYIWADGVYFNVRLEEDRLAYLVIIGVLPDGRKEAIAIEDGYRESTESWASLLRGLKRRGMPAPILAVGDGNLVFWAALREVYPETQEQRCWKHKTQCCPQGQYRQCVGQAAQTIAAQGEGHAARDHESPRSRQRPGRHPPLF